jgi:hypothetical protein
VTSAASRDHGARALVSAASSLPTHRDGTSERLCREPTPRRIAPRDASSTRAGFDRVSHRVAAFATRAPRPPPRRVSTRIDSPPRNSFPSVIARFAFPSAQDDAKLAEAIAQINEKRPDLPFFEPDDVIIEWDQCLGEGGFCTAYRAVWGGAHARDARRWLRYALGTRKNAHRIPYASLERSLPSDEEPPERFRFAFFSTGEEVCARVVDTTRVSCAVEEVATVDGTRAEAIAKRVSRTRARRTTTRRRPRVETKSGFGPPLASDAPRRAFISPVFSSVEKKREKRFSRFSAPPNNRRDAFCLTLCPTRLLFFSHAAFSCVQACPRSPCARTGSPARFARLPTIPI